MKIKGSSFYNTPEGTINANILAENSAKLNYELIHEHGTLSGTCLIMGYGEGGLVEHFKEYFSKIILIEGSKSLYDSAVKKYHSYPQIVCHHSYFELFEVPTDERVDVILGNHVLEHVDNPVEVLARSKSWLKDTGCAIFSVPNANSLHRRIGVKLKMLNTRYDLNDQDNLVGHQRVYDQETLLRDVVSAGYKIIEVGGFNLKLISQNQMKDWSKDLIRAIFEVSRECPPDICSNLYVVCKK
jgi:predicted SAM-dependent methyltransferase